MTKRLDELTRKEFLKDIDKRTKKYSKEVKDVKYKGITKDYVVIVEVGSVTADPPTTYIVKIKLLEYHSIENEKDLTVAEKVRLALAGDLAISCTCPAFRYWGYEYIITQLGSIEGPDQTIFPKVRNPKLEGTLCKHSYIAMRSFGRQWASITKDITNGNFI